MDFWERLFLYVFAAIILLCFVLGLGILTGAITNHQAAAQTETPALGDELIFPDGWYLAAAYWNQNFGKVIYICERRNAIGGPTYRECFPVRHQPQ